MLTILAKEYAHSSFRLNLREYKCFTTLLWGRHVSKKDVSRLIATTLCRIVIDIYGKLSMCFLLPLIHIS